MKVVIIGAGNVATNIALALKAVDVQVLQIWSYHYDNACYLADKIGASAIRHISEIDNDADICLLSVKDDAIEGMANQLTFFKGIVAHTSGAVSIDIFKKSLVANGVFYPLQTFSKKRIIEFTNIPLCVEANDAHSLDILKKLASKLSTNVVNVNSEKRKILHLAAVFACNFTNHLYALADEILEANEIEFDLLKPLILETAYKIQNAKPVDVQSGPAIRDDIQTLNKHKELLVIQPEMLEIYNLLSKSIKKTR